MKHRKLKTVLITSAVLALAVLSGCGNGSQARTEARESAIGLLESGDYEGAVQGFDALIQDSSKVTAFEIDVLKYRAEAEYGAGDYAAAAYTYEILLKVDGEKPEYYYFSALSKAQQGEIEDALELIDKGKNLDPEETAPGFAEAREAIGASYNTRMLKKMEDGLYEEALEVFEEGKELAGETTLKQLKFNEAVCYEYLGQFENALSLFKNYVSEFGGDEKAEHEIAFLSTR